MTSLTELARMADSWGRSFRKDATEEEKVKSVLGAREWTAVDAGNLARIAMAAEVIVLWLKRIEAVVSGISKRMPLLEKTLKLFTKVLIPVVEKQEQAWK